MYHKSFLGNATDAELSEWASDENSNSGSPLTAIGEEWLRSGRKRTNVYSTNPTDAIVSRN